MATLSSDAACTPRNHAGAHCTLNGTLDAACKILFVAMIAGIAAREYTSLDPAVVSAARGWPWGTYACVLLSAACVLLVFRSLFMWLIYAATALLCVVASCTVISLAALICFGPTNISHDLQHHLLNLISWSTRAAGHEPLSVIGRLTPQPITSFSMRFVDLFRG